jgi:hypothetical protein
MKWVRDQSPWQKASRRNVGMSFGIYCFEFQGKLCGFPYLIRNCHVFQLVGNWIGRPPSFTPFNCTDFQKGMSVHWRLGRWNRKRRHQMKLGRKGSTSNVDGF